MKMAQNIDDILLRDL